MEEGIRSYDHPLVSHLAGVVVVLMLVQLSKTRKEKGRRQLMYISRSVGDTTAATVAKQRREVSEE
jgi:hypothetical protein